MSRERDGAYDMVDKFLRNSLDDADYAEYLEALELLYTPEPEQDEEPFGYVSEHTTGGYYFHRKHSEIYWDTCVSFHKVFLHPAPRPEFVRLSEEEVNEILSLAHTPYEAICATENMLVRKNTINKSDPDSIDLQSKCRGDKL